MPVSITEDRIEGATFVYDVNGGQLDRIFTVEGLSPGSDTLAQAALAVDSSSGFFIPRYGQAHPKIAGMYVTRVKSDPLMKGAKSSVRVVVTYSSPQVALGGGVIVRGSGTSAMRILAKDEKGKPLFLTYEDLLNAGVIYTQTVKLQIPAPHAILEFERIEPNSPVSNIRQYVSKVNSASWQGGAAGTWMCREIPFESLGNVLNIGGGGYRVSYKFEYDELGWDSIAVYEDEITHVTPSDITPTKDNSNGVYSYKQPSANFGSLGLPNVG